MEACFCSARRRRLRGIGTGPSSLNTISNSPSASTSTRSSYFDRFGGTYGGIGDGSGGVGIGEAFARFRIPRPFAPLGRRHQARTKGAPHEWTPYTPSTNSSPWRSGAISREPRCFFVVALCLGQFPSRQRAVRNRYRMGRQSQHGFGLPRGMVDHSAGSRQPRANPLGRALSSAASATTNDRMASTRRLHLSGVTSERCAASS